VTACRYAVVISGSKAIREALLIKSLDFADRPKSDGENSVNNVKGSFFSVKSSMSPLGYIYLVSWL